MEKTQPQHHSSYYNMSFIPKEELLYPTAASPLQDPAKANPYLFRVVTPIRDGRVNAEPPAYPSPPISPQLASPIYTPQYPFSDCPISPDLDFKDWKMVDPAILRGGHFTLSCANYGDSIPFVRDHITSSEQGHFEVKGPAPGSPGGLCGTATSSQTTGIIPFHQFMPGRMFDQNDFTNGAFHFGTSFMRFRSFRTQFN